MDPLGLPGPRLDELDTAAAAALWALLAVLRAEAVRVLAVTDPRDPATPALAVIELGWLEAAEQALAAGISVSEMRVLLGVAGPGCRR